MNSNIGKNLKKFRDEKNLTLKQLSEISGVSISFISDIENGRRNPSNDTLNSLADALGVFVDRLTGESIGCLIEDRLKELNLTLEDLAERTKLPLNYLKSLDSIYPNGSDYNKVFYIAKALNMNPSILRAALARQEPPAWDESDRSTPEDDFSMDEEQLKKEVKIFEDADEILKPLGHDIIKVVDENISEKDILTMAAHKAGHEGSLSNEELEKIKLAIRIALAKKK